MSSDTTFCINEDYFKIFDEHFEKFMDNITINHGNLFVLDCRDLFRSNKSTVVSRHIVELYSLYLLGNNIIVSDSNTGFITPIIREWLLKNKHIQERIDFLKL